MMQKFRKMTEILQRQTALKALKQDYPEILP